MIVGYRSLYLYSLSRTSGDWLYADAVLHLPPHNCKPENPEDVIRCLTALFEGAPPREYTSFRVNPKERIHVLEICVQKLELAAYVVISTAGLLQYLEDISDGKANSGVHVNWDDWGPSHTAIINLRWETRALIAQRCVMYPIRVLTL